MIVYKSEVSEHVEVAAAYMTVSARIQKQRVVCEFNGCLLVANPGTTTAEVMAQWEAHSKAMSETFTAMAEKVAMAKLIAHLPPVHTAKGGCAFWISAHGTGTDNQAHGPLIYRGSPAYSGPTEPVIGTDLPPVKFCPWCGEKVA